MIFQPDSQKCLLKDLCDKLVVREPSYRVGGKLPIIYTHIPDAKEQQEWEPCACWILDQPALSLPFQYVVLYNIRISYDGQNVTSS